MKPLVMHQTWLGTMITLEVAAQFAWLAAIAIALRTLDEQRIPRS